MISKGNDQSNGRMIGAEMSAFLRVWKAFKHSSVNSKGASLASKFIRGLEIYEKSLINLLQNLAWPRKLRIPFMFTEGSSCLITSILALSTSIPLSDTKCPRTMPSQTIKWHFYQFSTRSFSWHLCKTLSKFSRQ
jgi:hypothetical protein